MDAGAFAWLMLVLVGRGLAWRLHVGWAAERFAPCPAPTVRAPLSTPIDVANIFRPESQISKEAMQEVKNRLRLECLARDLRAVLLGLQFLKLADWSHAIDPKPASVFRIFLPVSSHSFARFQFQLCCDCRHLQQGCCAPQHINYGSSAIWDKSGRLLRRYPFHQHVQNFLAIGVSSLLSVFNFKVFIGRRRFAVRITSNDFSQARCRHR